MNPYVPPVDPIPPCEVPAPEPKGNIVILAILYLLYGIVAILMTIFLAFTYIFEFARYPFAFALDIIGEQIERHR